MSISDRIRELRKRKGLTQEELSNLVDISRQMIGLIETGERKPGYKLLERFSEVFDVSVDYIMGNAEVKEETMISKESFISELLERLVQRGIIKDTNNISPETWEIIKNAVIIELNEIKKGI